MENPLPKFESLRDLLGKEGLGILDQVPKERKQEISNKVEALKHHYRIPPCDGEKLYAIAQDNNMRVGVAHWLVTGYHYNHSQNGYDGFILIPDVSVEFTLAHELGHMLLPTLDEAECDYFASQLTGKNQYIEKFGLISSIVKKMREEVPLYLWAPEYFREGLWKLEEEGYPKRFVDFIARDIKEMEERFAPFRKHLRRRQNI